MERQSFRKRKDWSLERDKSYQAAEQKVIWMGEPVKDRRYLSSWGETTRMVKCWHEENLTDIKVAFSK